MPIKQARFLDVKSAEDRSQFGLRVLTTRRWLRGCARTDIDVWLPDAGPSLALLTAYRKGDVDWSAFAARYQQEQRAATTCRIVRYANGKQVSDTPVPMSPLKVLEGLQKELGAVTVMYWEDTENQEPKKCHRHLLVAMMEPEPEVVPTWHEIFSQDVIEAEAVKNGIPLAFARKRRG